MILKELGWFIECARFERWKTIIENLLYHVTCMAAYCTIIICTLLEEWKCEDPYYYFSAPMCIGKNRPTVRTPPPFVHLCVFYESSFIFPCNQFQLDRWGRPLEGALFSMKILETTHCLLIVFKNNLLTFVKKLRTLFGKFPWILRTLFGCICQRRKNQMYLFV